MYLFVCLLSVNACSVCLGEYASPGQNYKEIGFLLVLDKICMSKKRIKRIDPQNNAQAGPEGTQHALHIKHIHLYCMVTESFANENHLFAERNCEPLLAHCFPSIRSLPSVSGG